MPALQALKLGGRQGGEKLAGLRQLFQPGGVVSGSIKQCLVGHLLGHVLGMHAQQPGLPTFMQGLVGQCLKLRSLLRRCWQQVGTVAQGSAAQCLDCTPNPHARSGCC